MDVKMHEVLWFFILLLMPKDALVLMCR